MHIDVCYAESFVKNLITVQTVETSVFKPNFVYETQE